MGAGWAGAEDEWRSKFDVKHLNEMGEVNGERGNAIRWKRKCYRRAAVALISMRPLEWRHTMKNGRNGG